MNILFVEASSYKIALDNYIFVAIKLQEKGHKVFFLFTNNAAKDYMINHGQINSFNVQDFIVNLNVKTPKQLYELSLDYEKRFESVFNNPKYEIASIRSIYLPHLAYMQRKEDPFKDCKEVMEFLEAVENFFIENKFDLVFQIQGGELIRRCTSVVAIQHCVEEYYVGSTPLKGYTTLNKNYFNCPELELINITDQERNEIKQYIDEIVNKKITHVTVSKTSFTEFWINRIKNNIAFNYEKDEYSDVRIRLQKYFKKIFYKHLGRFIGNFIFSKANKDEKYMFLPLHYPAETQITVNSNMFMDQFHLVRIIAYSLPQGVTLYTREHPGVLGCLSINGLLKLSKIPNVKIISPDINPHEIIKNSAGVITINSTAGYEALMHGKPVITFGKVFYRGLGLTYDIQTLNDIPVLIRKALHNYKENKEDLYKLIAAIKKVSNVGSISTVDKQNELAASYEKIVDKKEEQLKQPVSLA